ncbi:MAG: DnaA ATPase domain-containing protein [Lacipirellulaceae bacterium]
MLQAFRDTLCEQVGAQRYATWFEGQVTVDLVDGELRIVAASEFVRDLIRSQFSSEVRDVARRTLGVDATISYAARAPEAEVAPVAAAKPQAAVAPRPPQSSAAATDHLADWVEGDANAEATLAVRRLIAGDRALRLVFLWGPAGTGKTHLLRALADGVRGRDRRRVQMLSAEKFLVGFVEACRGGGLPSFRVKHRGLDLLMIDNAHQLVGKARTLEELLHTLDALEADGATVVLTSDRAPHELRELGPELVSRLSGGVSAELRLPSAPMRCELVRRTAHKRGIELSDGAVERLGVSLVGGAREVSGALSKLELHAQTYGAPIDELTVERVADEVNRVATPPVKLADIQRAVCGVFGVDAASLCSAKRTKNVSEPRMLAMWLARRLTQSAWSEIGDHFGRRSHSTVIAAHRRVERLLATPRGPRLTVGGDVHDAIRRVEAALRTA